MRALKTRGFRLSVDMQNFVLQADEKTGVVQLKDVPEKKEILDMADFVKLDAMEAQTLTGAEVLQDQADMLEELGKFRDYNNFFRRGAGSEQGENYVCEIYQQEHPGQDGSGRHRYGIVPGT